LKKNIRLGLDLKGGSLIVMQIQVQDAFKAEADRAVERLKEALGRSGVAFAAVERNDPDSVEAAEAIQITINGVQPERFTELRRVTSDAVGQGWAFLPDEGTGLRLGMRKESAVRLRQDTTLQCIATMERRINGLGVAETSIQQRGGSDGTEILIQLPGIDDPAHVKEVLKTAAMLELSPVIDGPFSTQEAANAAREGTLPPNSRIVRGGSRAGNGETWWLLSRSPVVTGRDLRDARVEPGELGGRWDTGFLLMPDAAERFGQFTEANIGKRLAIVLDNEVLSAPRIDSRISDHGRIMGAPSRQDAADLALNLRAGSLPAGVKLIEERTIGPSLGADSISRGITAGAVGLALVVASMIAYYRGAGVNAVLALLMNTIITVAALSYLEATWTLPGIAGLVLSIGLAVDSNVLIFERIKEELRSGKRAASAIAAGFDRALTTIIDTHVTTIVASAFLFLFGTGPVRGFAVTLVIGLLANLFTAVFASRAIFDIQLRLKPGLSSLSIGSLRTDPFNRSGIDFMRRCRLTLAISALLVCASVAAILGYGLKPGLDFRGGTSILVRIDGTPAIDGLRHALSNSLSGEVSVQEAGGAGGFIIGTGMAAENTLSATREKVEQTLSEKYGPMGRILSAEIVGPRAGEKMRSQALTATLGALGGMLIYVAFRFKWISGLAAIIATVHDVLITLGLFAWTGREINLNTVAALLTLIGYSMNDKIVVFDRVRENQRLGRRDGSFLDLVNQSINQTLSRTLLTAGPMLLACLALYFLGGDVLNGIAFALLTGTVVGTYSSIFVASPLLAIWNERRRRAG
jgi:protein-export membrane protein SecD/preprotein translocase SecF subunit